MSGELVSDNDWTQDISNIKVLNFYLQKLVTSVKSQQV